mgnify:CR=1 FL=1
MEISNKPVVQKIIQECLNHGIKHIVFSPGSRNVPLAIGFASNYNFKCYSIVDERSAGFFALGIAQQKQKPVMILHGRDAHRCHHARTKRILFCKN